MKKLFLAAIVLASATATTNAQVMTTANATATIVAPINITKITDMNFGNLASSAVAGDVTLSASATPTRIANGGVTLPANTGTVAAARFTVSGAPDYTYDVVLPGDFTILLESGGSPSMATASYTSSVGLTGGQLDNTGVQELYIGATLYVDALQPAGIYTTTSPFAVFVNYN